MKGLKITAFVIFLFVLIPNVQAQEYNITDGRGFLLFQETVLSEPLDPKVACHPDGIHCLLLVYENNTFFGRGIKIWFTTNFFKDIFTRTQIGSVTVDFSAYVYGFWDNFHLPYDVSFVASENKYYLFIQNTVYSFDGISFVNEGNIAGNQAGKRWGLGYYSETQLRSFEPFLGSGTSETFSRMKGTVLGDGEYSINAEWSGSAQLRFHKTWYNGSFVDATTSFLCAGCSNFNGSVGLTNFPTNFTGLDYNLDGEIVYQRLDNSSHETFTDDFTTFIGTALIYDWNGSREERLNNSDSSLTTANRIFAYRRHTNETDKDGIWIYNLPVNNIIVFGEGFDPARKTAELVNLTVSLNCSKENHFSSDVGQFAQLNTPCNDGNVIIIQSFTFRPNVFIFNNFTISANCEGLDNFIRTDETKAYYKPYDFTVTFLDAIFGNRINGVTSVLNGDTETSDSSGQTVHNIFPIQGENFTTEKFIDACTDIMTFTGSPKEFVLISSKSGYETSTENFRLAEEPFDVETDFTTSRIVFLEPVSTVVNVKVFSQDGIEISPSRIRITLEGSNSTFWSLNNELFETNIATISPAKFILLNNTGTFEINVTVDYFGNFTVFANATVSETIDIDVFVNFSSWELPCFTVSDCQSDLCTGQFFKRLLDCVSNQCQYQTFDCESSSKCDVNLGCVDLISTTNCTRNTQCANFCSDNFTMVDNKCGIDGFCKGNFIECESQCNSTLGFCSEMEQCVLRNVMEFRAGFVDTSSLFIGSSADVFCDFSNVNQHTCAFPEGIVISGTDLANNGKTFDDIIVTPSGWLGALINDNQDLKLYGVSIFCDRLCNITWNFCENGCDIETGQCKGEQVVTQDVLTQASEINNIFTGFFNWYMAVFNNIHIRSLMWLIYGILILVFLNIISAKVLPKQATFSLGAERDIMIFVAWIFIGSVAQQFYEFVWIVLTVIAVFLLATYFVNKQRQVGG